MEPEKLDYEASGAGREAREEGIATTLLAVANLLTAALSIPSLGWFTISFLINPGRNPERAVGGILLGGAAALLLGTFGGCSALWACDGPKRRRGELMVVFIPWAVTLAMLVLLVASDVFTR